MNNQKCRDCKYCKSTRGRYAIRLSYMCTHPYQKMILDYFREHQLCKMPGFIAFSVNSIVLDPNIKTSPTWCPIKLSAKNKVKS